MHKAHNIIILKIISKIVFIPRQISGILEKFDFTVVSRQCREELLHIWVQKQQQKLFGNIFWFIYKREQKANDGELKGMTKRKPVSQKPEFVTIPNEHDANNL